MPYVLLFIGCVGFLIGGIGLNIDQIQHFDFNSVVWMSTHRLEALNGITLALSYLGGLPSMIVITGLCSIYFIRQKQYANILMMSLGLLGASIIGWILKYLVDRPRPDEVFQIVKTYGASFPSAHSIYAAVLCCSIMFIFQKHQQVKLIYLMGFLWFFSMGISRVYLGAHFPTDVFAGWGIGFIWAAMIWLILSSATLSRNKIFLDKNLNEVE
ncbi:PAP2 family protein [Acinetobacter wuhouensis]|uniref:phosphatase PAP2 family protein n=1 Tax=Acinetobacter wuhouensis TaxID=1879050 RepID=UPI00083B6CA9|nr:phosphatase PAP2 family protein [Acinetobacter wuhouensis]AXQ23130.1 PAP2 family protein [Acinetobacter wuhouensis]